jgi:Ser/Thr protein kinase RdoA (MazF antagonist)
MPDTPPLPTSTSSPPPAVPARTHLGPVVEGEGHYDRIAAHELAVVLSHYDLGIINEIKLLKRGSRRAPKLRIRSTNGHFMLKRRAPGRDDPYRVAFAHDLQLHLEQRGYPVPRLVGTRTDNNSMLQLDNAIYEMFTYINGSRFNRSAVGAELSGRALGSLHRILSNHASDFEAPRSSYHGIADVQARFSIARTTIAQRNTRVDLHALDITSQYLSQAYRGAAQRVVELGYAHWAPCILHGDWHPGNLLYRDQSVVAVLDFDSARIETRMADVANGALQFAIRMGSPDDVRDWPDDLDIERIRRFVAGYQAACGQRLGPDERAALPWLMIEALILESIMPIAGAGAFANIDGLTFLQMVERKVRWITPAATTITTAIPE